MAYGRLAKRRCRGRLCRKVVNLTALAYIGPGSLLTGQDGRADARDWDYQAIRAVREGFRDALAHRIPLYIPPFSMDPANVDQWTALGAEADAALFRGESFNGKVRIECLNTAWFMSFDDARSKCEAWRKDYNEHCPHSAIGDKCLIKLMNGAGPYGPPGA